MTVLPNPFSLPDLDSQQDPGVLPDPFAEVGEYAPHNKPETAMDGSPALRPGDPDPAPQPDNAPIFSTDPLGD